jgi:hypothetical protein
MNCPRCRDPLLTVIYEDFEVDYCESCGGVWLDAGELETLTRDDERLAEILGKDAASPSREPSLRCPICRRRMKKYIAQTTPPILYDMCPAGEGIWLDRGELEAVLHATDNENLTPLAQRLLDLLGHTLT